MMDKDENGKFPDHGTDLLNGFAKTISFDVNNVEPKISGAFLSSYGLEVYANEGFLVFASNGYSYDKETSVFKDYTYLVQFGLDEAMSSPIAIGKVPGYFLNQFSIDHYNGHLRIATTSSAKWGYDKEIERWREMSPSTNQLIVLKEVDGELEEAGKIEDIAVGESIYSVRFFEEKAFIVTFERIDPFFTIDLSDPQNPNLVGELKIPGFSNYLHMIDENYVLAVGQDANETTGRTTGMQISLFDVSNFAKPQRVQQTVIKGWSNSDAQYDHMAFRYFSNTLILPVEVYNDFDGFQVYDINATDGIKSVGNVTHADSALMEWGCFSNTYISSRSMVFNGRLMTMKGHSIIMSDSLEDPSTLWTLNLDMNRNKTSQTDCMPWFRIGW